MCYTLGQWRVDGGQPGTLGNGGLEPIPSTRNHGRARMTPETVTLIRYRVARAGEALAEATLLLAHEHVDSGGASGS